MRTSFLTWSKAASTPFRAISESVTPMRARGLRSMSIISSALVNSPSTPSEERVTFNVSPSPSTTAPSEPVKPSTAGLLTVADAPATKYSVSRVPSVLSAVEPSAPISSDASSIIWSVSPSTPSWASNRVKSTFAVMSPEFPLSRPMVPSALTAPAPAFALVALGASAYELSTPASPKVRSPLPSPLINGKLLSPEPRLRFKASRAVTFNGL